MKKANLVVAAICAIFLLSVPASSQDKPRIAVLEFENQAGVSWWYSNGSSAAQDVFITQLVKTGKFRVLDRETLNVQLSEQDLSLTGRIDAATAVSAGKTIGVQYFLTGALTEWEHEQQSASSGRFLRGIRGKKNKWSAAMNLKNAMTPNNAAAKHRAIDEYQVGTFDS